MGNVTVCRPVPRNKEESVMTRGQSISWRLGHAPLPVLANCLAARPCCNPCPDPSCEPGPGSGAAPTGPAGRPATEAWVALLCDPDYVIILSPPGLAQGGAAPALGGGPGPEQAQPAGFEPRQVQRLGFGREAGMVSGAAWAPDGAALAVACQRALFVAAVARGLGPRDTAANSSGLGPPAAGAVAAAEGAQGVTEGIAAASPGVQGAVAACGGQGAGGSRGDQGVAAVQGSQVCAERVSGHFDQGARTSSDGLELVLRIPLFFWPKGVALGEALGGCLRLALAGAPGVVLYRVARPLEVCPNFL